MGRAGITLLDVEKAAIQLQGRGKTPTVDGIREILGTGSKSTIAGHLRTWKTQQTIGQGNLPQDLVALVTGLWERLNSQAEQRIAEIENTSTQEILKLKQVLASLNQDNSHLKNQLHQSEESHIAERSAKEALQKELHVAQENHATLNERYQAIHQQINDYKSENVRLHGLANNIQANLEHYQNAMQQLRTEQTLAVEKQQAQLQQEINDLKKELSSSQSRCREFENQLKHKFLELEQAEKQSHALQENFNKLEQRSHKNDHELTLYQVRYEQQMQTINTQEKALEKKDNHILTIEKQLAVLTDQVNFLQNGCIPIL